MLTLFMKFRIQSKGRRRLPAVAALSVFIFTAASLLFRAYSAPGRTYVGMEKCERCHANDGIGNQYAKWVMTPHSRSLRALKSDEGKAIAAKLGIGDPLNDKQCLKCHTTGGGNSEKTLDEGVGCEACHGPASDYYELNNHASLTDREGAYRKALTLGMYPIIGIDHIRYREKLCLRCHTPERPCAPEDPKKKKQQVLSLEVIADFIFKHPVRR